eukprot:gnl/TRDRNA2_/TRDRNA2_120111_c1_seq1.p1 gnl/TRDRNA2_/TRDRNA2_120111_c1~~gnl/TRDRNA2_/TRDRNA2_120111_c1_seq1.p1  ORF type:complete len:529 (+),score=108.70 gnl/TRDRNA2_/TRDRNA2_120111_c1_seq1:144-1589(+)
MDINELAAMMKEMGYTPLRQKMQELIEEADEDGNGALDFDEFVNMMGTYRETDGFTRAEVEELKEAFEEFDYDDSGQMCVLELKDLLRHLGYQVNLEYVHRQIAKFKADLNEHNELDFREVLRLMRLHREEELRRINDAFCAFHYVEEGDEDGVLPPSKLRDALKALGPLPNDAIVMSILDRAKSAGPLDFDAFVETVDKIRRTYVKTLRSHAGYTDEEISAFKEIFDSYDQDGNGVIERDELTSFLIEANIPMDSAKARDRALSQISAAKKLSMESGLDSNSGLREGDASMTFWTLVHLMRLLKDEEEQEEEDVNRKAVESAGFTLQQVDDFRQVFSHWAVKINEKDKCSKLLKPTSSSRNLGADPEKYRSSESHICASPGPSDLHRSSTGVSDKGWVNRGSIQNALNVPTHLAFDGLRSILYSLGVSLSKNQCTELEEKFQSYDLDARSRMNFSNFLLLMRWMQDENFAGIRTAKPRAA